MPGVPGARVVVVMVKVGFITMVKVAVALVAFASTTCTWTLLLPAVVGVPLINPDELMPKP